MIATLVLIYALGAITWLATRGGGTDPTQTPNPL